MCHRFQHRNRQSGIALITVLLILTLATVAAVSMTSRQQLDIRRTSNMLQIEQAYAALLAGEEMARALLVYDETQGDNKGKDSNIDFWARLALLDTSSGVVNIGDFTLSNVVIEDLQGRFNINNLRSDKASVFINTFESLLGKRRITTEEINPILDWLDGNQQETLTKTGTWGNGREDPAYSGFVRPFKTADQHMASASEILRFGGIRLANQDYDCQAQVCLRTMVYKEPWLDPDAKPCEQQGSITQLCNSDLTPLLTALPMGQGTNPTAVPININMPASPQIYQALVPKLSDNDAEALYNEVMNRGGPNQPSKPAFDQPSNFTGHDKITGLLSNDEKTDVLSQISVSSNFFLLRLDARPTSAGANAASNQHLTVSLNSILYRSGTGNNIQVRVIHRSFGKFGEI